MTRLKPISHGVLRMVMGMVVVAGAACDPAAIVEHARDLARKHHGKRDGMTPENPCNLIDCKPGTSCVVLETDPPQASCQPDVASDVCYSNEDCGDGLVCSVSLGECARSPACSPDGPCDTVCTGTCVMGGEPTNPCAAILCGPGTTCAIQKTNPPTATCEPIDNPCAYTTCPAGNECVVLESFPPQAKCVAIEQPQTCYATSDCAPGKTCSLERGDCQPHPGCKDGQACPAVCVGVCEDFAPAGSCRSDADCKVHSNYCGGCSCEAVGPDSGVSTCSDPVQCLLDPCEGKRAVCSAGKCTVAANEPKCDTQVMGGDTSCKSDEVWKRYVTEACAGGMVTYMGFGRSCDGGHREVKYTCCR